MSNAMPARNTVKTPSDQLPRIAHVLLLAAVVVGSLLAHAALLTGTLLVYSALAAVPSAPVSLALLFGLPLVVAVTAFAFFSRYAQALVWRAVLLALLTACAVGQVISTPFWSCPASRSFCL